MANDLRVERGWIYVDGTRQDDGTIALGTGNELRYSPFDALSHRDEVPIPMGAVLKASVQRLAFWRR
ncbi:MAG TPA: hypothetical protein VI318_13315 [Baekduia sp.]